MVQRPRLAALTALIPFAVIIWSHTASWPFGSLTDTYVPQGPTDTFSDFSPSDRTGVLTTRGRPITGSPVYLLFQPRRHSKKIRVEIFAAPSSLLAATDLKIGYRHGSGPEGNIFVRTEIEKKDDGIILWAVVPFDEMTRERTDARRIVFEAPRASTSTPIFIQRVNFFYVDN